MKLSLDLASEYNKRSNRKMSIIMICFEKGIKMAKLYPSWIEIPVSNLERAMEFYRAVFNLDDTPIYEDYPPARIAVLLPSEKSVQNPGVSLVQSPTHVPSKHGALINFHIGNHATLEKAVEIALANAGAISEPMVDMGDGVKYLVLLDSEGNSIALSSYEPIDEDESAE